MRIAVIAASGRSGQAFVNEALARGHIVRAGVHSSNPFSAHENLTVFKCDATNLEQVTKLIDRSEAVVSLIGHVKGSDEYVQTNAIKVILRAMEVAGVNKIVSLTGVGVGPKNCRSAPFIQWLSKQSTRIGIERLQDGLAHARALESSRVDWTIIKVLLLTNGKPGKFKVKTRGLVKAPTPRREVAMAILQILEEGKHKREYTVITR